MAVSDGEMEAPLARKWHEAVWETRERKRANHNEEEEEGEFAF